MSTEDNLTKFNQAFSDYYKLKSQYDNKNQYEVSKITKNNSLTNKEKQELKVVFKYVQKKKDQVIYQDGYVYNKETGAEWRVRPRFFGGTIPLPLWLPFLVLDCPSEEQPDYPMVVGYPDRSYLWIMSRKINMDESLYSKVVERCKIEWEYDTSKIIKVEQNWPQ